jgi:ditrans,polycis-polyprenyl diphosphate synthase
MLERIRIDRCSEHFPQTIRWSKELGIKEVTIYAFSIENFKRDEQEVQLLMNLAAEKFGQLLTELDQLKTDGICVRFFGKLELLPVHLQRMIGELMLATRSNCKSQLNVCLAYTARHELASAADRLTQAGQSFSSMKTNDIDAELVSRCLDTRSTSDPDVLIRTSGELRFSDFLLWQTAHSQLIFTNVLWPECRVHDFFRIIFTYQLQTQLKTSGRTSTRTTSNDQIELSDKSIESQESCDSGHGTEDSGSDSALSSETVDEHIDRMHVTRLQRMRLGHSLQRPPPTAEPS